MTNYIEDMMQTAGVAKQYYAFYSGNGKKYTWELNEDGNKEYNMYFIGKPKLEQREFSPEKQLEIIKLIGSKIYVSFALYGREICFFYI